MSDQSPSGANGQAQPNGAAAPAEEPRQSLRDIAEAAYDNLTEDAGEGADQQPTAEPGEAAQPRDERGRFVPKQEAEPGEAAPEGTQPREDQRAEPQRPTQPAPAVSSEAPANWPQEARSNFEKLSPEMKSFVIERHTSMESDYQRRVQANARAAEFATALTPVFRDPVISGSLQQAGMSPHDAIVEWAGFHRRAMSQNVQDRVGLLFDLAQRMQIDPAVFTTGQPGVPGLPGISSADLKDPAIKFFADHISRNASEVQALRGQLQAMQNADAERQSAEALKVTRWSIDSFADEKGRDGKPLRPDFDKVLDQIIELYRANPQRDLREAYETARWMVPTTRQALIAAERQSVERQEADRRAAQAVRSNVRGMTSPVSKPVDNGQAKGLRATLEGVADEIGL